MLKSAHKIMPDWSQLPKELLECIVRRLTVVVDHLKFSWVCSSWRSTALEFRPYFPPPLPGLIIPGPGDYSQIRLFASLSNKVYKHTLPISHTEVVVRSTGGSLVSFVTLENHHLHILNPFSNLRVPLPLPPVSARFSVAALSSYNPNKAIVMLALIESGTLAFARPGDTSWSVIVEKVFAYRDIIFYKGAFYILGDFGTFVCDIEDPNPKTKLIAPPIVALSRSYLVESAGELLQVLRYIRNDAFDVYRLDMSMKKWKQVNSLGDRALFLGSRNSFSVSSLNYEDCSSDCIYFTNNFEEYRMGKRLAHDMGIFYLKDGSIKRLRLDEGVQVIQPERLGPDYGIRDLRSGPIRSGPIWVTPLPW